MDSMLIEPISYTTDLLYRTEHILTTLINKITFQS